MTIAESLDKKKRSSGAPGARAYRGDLRRTIARRRKAKDLAGSLHLAQKQLVKVAKAARTLVLRNIIRKDKYSEEKKAELISSLKNTSHQEIGEKAFDAIKNGSFDGNLASHEKGEGASFLLVLRHSSMRAAMAEWAQRIKAVLGTLEQKEAARREREAAGPAKHFSEDRAAKKSVFVGSLADAEEEEDEEEQKRKAEIKKSRKKFMNSTRPIDLSIYMPVSDRPLDKQTPRRTPERSRVAERPRYLRPAASAEAAPRSYGATVASNKSSNFARDAPKHIARGQEEQESMHPSWTAKKLLKEKLAYTKTVPQGKKIVFNEDDA